MAPLFSIVTVTFNSIEHLPALYASLCAQQCQDFEWVVVDGASTDATAAFLAQAVGLRLRYVSEPDAGIYDAMNKATRMCRGKFILFLGADDVLADDAVLADVAGQADSEVDLLLGTALDGRGQPFASTLGLKTYLMNTVHHQSAFYRRTLFDSFAYDHRSRVVADYELNVCLQKNGHRYRQLSRLIALCGRDGISNSTSEYRLYRDMHHLRRRHIPGCLSWLAMLAGSANVWRRSLRHDR